MKPAEAFGDCLSILVVKLRFGLENGKEKAMKKLTSMTAKKRLFESGKRRRKERFNGCIDLEVYGIVDTANQFFILNPRTGGNEIECQAGTFGVSSE